MFHRKYMKKHEERWNSFSTFHVVYIFHMMEWQGFDFMFLLSSLLLHFPRTQGGDEYNEVTSTHTNTQTHRDTQRQTEKQRDRHTEPEHTQLNRHTRNTARVTQAKRQTDKDGQVSGNTERNSDKHSWIESHPNPDIKIDR